MRLTKADIGRPVEVAFLDHAEGANVEPTWAVGYLDGYSRNHLTLRHWRMSDPDGEVAGSSTESIVRSAITALNFLKRA